LDNHVIVVFLLKILALLMIWLINFGDFF